MSVESVDQEITELLASYQPFDALSPDERSALAAVGEIVEFGAGALIVDAFAATPDDLLVILSGEVNLWYDADRVAEGPADRFRRGATLGFTAVLAGQPTGPRAVADTRARVVRFPADRAIGAFTSREGARFLAEHISHVRGLKSAQPMYTLVADLIQRQPLVVAQDITVTELARRMTERGLSYAAVDAEAGGFGLVTDEALRRRVLAEGLSRQTAVAEVMAYPAVTVWRNMSAGDALIQMLDHDVEFLLVEGDEGHLEGAVGERDFMLAPTTAGVGINEQIRQARSVDSLARHARRVPALLADLIRRGLSADRVISVHSAIVDSITRRAIFLVFERHEDLSIEAFTWLSLGSNGRREAVLSSDVDAAVTFADEYEDQIPRYREVFEEVGDVLNRCGISVDANHAFPSHKGFSRTDSQWREAAQGWLANPQQNQGTIMASLLVDARPIFGDPSLPEPARVFGDFNRHPATVGILLTDSLSRRARLMSMRDRIIGRGEQFDIKARGLLPIVNIARWGALSVGSTELHTTRRLEVAAGSQVLPERSARRLIEAFDELQLLRLEHQLRQYEAGRPPDDLIDLDELSPIERSVIEQTVREIAAVQRRMSRVAHMVSGKDLVEQGQPVDRVRRPGARRAPKR
ncbi:MAG: putative nucleotidyltransferase substrate binding domain-containing protein [Gordonia sp. (in: high G+C Gram-positive bacteria)]|uniref:putative nucleotidyltransferase substrate binding domain-containing protein n=1 Tax=Gordonia sp. (in: high G+C Gram-positive bacteria) TaxID=84139 RepID=UPI0039E5EC47